MSEKPLAARCVVPAIACKALSAREDSRVERSPGPWDRCSPLEARAELQKGSGSSTRCTGQSRGGTANATHPINSQNQVVLGQLSAERLRRRILFSPHLYCIHVINSVDAVQGCKRQSFQPRARPGFFQVLKHLIVQNVGAFDASCNCSCGKEATELLPSVSHVLTYPSGWSQGGTVLAQRQPRDVVVHKVLYPMVHASFKVTLQHRDRERQRHRGLCCVPFSLPHRAAQGKPVSTRIVPDN